jgi:predicted acylesterase/phospholipase RssA/CRP-like cAMP-binding protein
MTILRESLESIDGSPREARRLRLAEGLRRRMSIARFEPGETIVRQGEPMRRLFLIASGTVRVLLGKGEQVQQVARLDRGAWIGETALLTGSASSTTVLAESDVRVLTIAHEDFLEAAKTDPSVFRELATELAGRLRSSNDLLEGGRAHRTVALLHGNEHAQHAAAILRACERWSAEAFVAIGTGGIAEGQYSVEEYVADPLRLAGLRHRIAARLPASIRADGSPREDVASLLRSLAEFVPLVIVAGGELSPETTPHVTEALSLVAHDARAFALPVLTVPHETWRVGRGFDADAVARRICRQRIGLALGGGAARGFAHLGVLQALAEASIPVDVLTGASIGAAVAAGVAMGQPLEALGATIESLGRWAVVPHILPGHSVFTGTFLEMQLKRRFPRRRIEELGRVLGIAAVDFDTAEEVVFTSGELLPALMASMAIPGIFSPVRHGGRLLVDGALVSPVPVRACRDLGADIVLSSRIRVEADAQSTSRAGSKRLPWLPETISQALDIMRDHIASESVDGVDIAIETAIPRPWARLFDFSHRAEVQGAGYMAARASLERAPDAVPGLRRAA